MSAARAARGDATLAALWERILQRGDMPGFTKAISAILGAMRGEDEPEFNMAQSVLSDPVLTQKVLRLANSGMYAAFGQGVNTISKAVLVLGTEVIGHLALGLKLIEELSGASPDSVMAHAEMEKAVLAGMVAQQVAASAQSRDTEEAVVCSMLHTLGRMMLTFYLPERWLLLQQHGGPGQEHGSADAVLGLSFEEIGRATAQRWGLPSNLIHGMRTIAPVPTEHACAHDDWVAAISTMSSRCADAIWDDDEAGASVVAALASSYAGMLGVDSEQILAAVEKAKVAAATELTIAPLAKPAEKRAQQALATRQRAVGNEVLVRGVADMRGAQASASPGQMMSMALETVYQGLNFSRTVAFLRNRREHRYLAKMGFGTGVRELIAQMVFDDAYEPNVFHAALNSDRVIFIENAMDPNFAAKLPQWWRNCLSSARGFVILPLTAHGQPAGFIYGDWDTAAPHIALTQTEFSLLNDLRALVVASVERQKSGASYKVA